jgi:hypothetical protein
MESKSRDEEPTGAGAGIEDENSTQEDANLHGDTPKGGTPTETEEDLIARGNRILDDPDTPLKQHRHSTPKSRHDSIGITNLELKMQMMAKEGICEKNSGS